VGLAGSMASGMAIASLQSRSSTDGTIEALKDTAKQVTELISKDEILKAQIRATDIDSKARTPKGAFISPEAQAIAERSQAEIKKWFANAYGDLTAEEETFLMQLFTRQGVKTSAGARRVRAFNISGKKVSMSVITEGTKQADSGVPDFSTGDVLLDEARTLLVTTFEDLKDVDEIELKMLGANGADEGPELESFTVSRKHLSDMKQFNDAAILKRKAK
jgi:hypothetical protein